MFAIFRKRASKMLAELGALRKKEADLVKRAQDMVATDQAIDALVLEFNQTQAVVDALDERDGY